MAIVNRLKAAIVITIPVASIIVSFPYASIQMPCTILLTINWMAMKTMVKINAFFIFSIPFFFFFTLHSCVPSPP